MLLFSRSFRVLRFLNRRHIAPVRGLFAGLGFVTTLAITGQMTLARQSASEFWSGSFKPAGRRIGWCLRTGWPHLHIAHDPFFNFTESMTPALIADQERFLQSAQKRLSQASYAGDALLICAYRAHAALVDHDRAAFQQQRALFAKLADTVMNSTGDDAPRAQTQATPKKAFEDFPKLAADTMKDLTDAINSTPWQCFVTGGTLLGAVRMNDFLPHDDDIDVGIFLPDSDVPQLAATFRDLDTFTMTKLDTKSEVIQTETGDFELVQSPAFLKLVHINGINIDIFFHEEVDGKFLHGSGTMMWENAAFGFSEYTLGTQTVLGPDDADLYLTEHYGNWKQEKKDFSCVTDTTNIAYVKNFFTIAFHIKRLNFLRDTDPMRADMIARAMVQQDILHEDGDHLAISPRLFA